jgi:hypothetical protein
VILLYPLGKLPAPANRTKENEIHCPRVCFLIELFNQFFLGNSGQKITPAALAPGAIRIMSPLHGQFTQSLDKIPETYARRAPFGAYFTGKTIPDGRDFLPGILSFLKGTGKIKKPLLLKLKIEPQFT